MVSGLLRTMDDPIWICCGVAGKVTAADLESWGSYGDDALWDTATWEYDTFTIHYPQTDGSTMVVTWAAKGISPADLASLVHGTTVALPEGDLQAVPLE